MSKTFEYNRIKIILEKNGRSQKWLAENLSTTTVTVNHWCLNKSQPPIKKLYKIAELLNIRPSELLNED